MIYSYLGTHTRFLPDKIAIQYISDEDADPNTIRLTFFSLHSRVDHLANQLLERWKIHKGDRVAWLGKNHPDMFVLLFAASKVGAIVTPLNWRLADDELQYIITDAAPRLLFTDGEHEQRAMHLIQTDSTINLTKFGFGITSAISDKVGAEDQQLPFPVVDQDDPFLLVYTSGTTGRPKGAVLSHRAVLCNAQMSQHMYDLSPDDTILNVLPLFHVGGINIQPLPALMYGATLVLHRQFNPGKTLAAIQEHKITLINTVPTIMQAMVRQAEWHRVDLTTLRSVSIGSTDVPTALIHAIHEKDIPLVQIYGSTETGPIAIYQRPEFAFTTVGSIGRAGALCDIRLVDEDDSEVDEGVPGEICVRGDNILSRYWNNGQATQSALRGGWFHTGDVAHLDTEGNFWFDGRLKHVIISGGENIYPAEIERILDAEPGVAEASVVALPDGRWGEIPVAVIVSDSERPISEANVIGVCIGKLAKFKIPKHVVFVESLPRNALGKIDTIKVKQLVQQALT